MLSGHELSLSERLVFVLYHPPWYQNVSLGFENIHHLDFTALQQAIGPDLRSDQLLAVLLYRQYSELTSLVVCHPPFHEQPKNLLNTHLSFPPQFVHRKVLDSIGKSIP